MDGFKKALAYIQDFINIYGIKIWQEEFNRLMNAYIDLEARQLTGFRVIHLVIESDFKDEI